MDWNLAIERNREALKRILAMLVAMAGLADGAGNTLPRHLHRAILRLLRPAESAVRRLVIVTARGLVVTLPPARPRKAKPRPTFLRKPGGTGILMPRGPSLARGPHPARSPCRCSIRSGPSAHRSGRRRAAFPASRCPASPRRFPSRPAARPRPTIRSTRPASRSASRRWVLRSDDLPRQARRFARWRAARVAGRTRRVWPLRPGRPPGQRPAARRTHEVHEILHDLHGLAFDVLEHPDTS